MRRRDIMSTYCTVSSSDKFEFLYEYYYNYKNILSCERSCVIYMIESFMMKYHWDEYCKYYNAPNRNNMITRIAECMNKGEVIDFILEDVKLPDSILFSYKNYIAMRIDFRIFANALNSIGGKDEELLRRYVMREIDLQGIATERTIAYETAKGKIRDLKKLLKERTLSFLEEGKVA